MMKYPMTFTVQSLSESGIQSKWVTHAPNYFEKIPLSIPPEFNGPGEAFSPEDLYAMALQNCFVATFKVFAEKSRLQFQIIQVTSHLEVDRNEQGQPWMSRIELQIHLYGINQRDLAERVLQRTSENCMILNSVNTKKSFKFIVHTEEKSGSLEIYETENSSHSEPS